MTRSKTLALMLGVALITTPAWAVKVGEMLYIKNKDTKVLKTAVATGAQVTTLQPGTEVIWNGADEKDKKFHKVKAGAKEGFVLQANLSPGKVQMEVASDGKPTSMGSLASSGAATRTMSDVGQARASATPDLTTSGKQVVLLELINAKVTDKEIAEFAKALQAKAGGK